MTIEQLESLALSQSEQDRERLAHRLIASLSDDLEDVALEAVNLDRLELGWDDEMEARYDLDASRWLETFAPDDR